MRAAHFVAAFCLCNGVLLLQAAELHPGDTIQNSLAPGATGSYTLNLQSGDVVSMEFADTGKDVILTVSDPAGGAARRFSSKLQEGEAVTFYAGQSGSWGIQLS